MYEIKSVINFDYIATVEKIAKLQYMLEHVRLSKTDFQRTIENISVYREQCISFLLFYFNKTMSESIQELEIDIFEYLYNHKMR